MAHKKKNGGPVPRANESKMGTAWSARPAKKAAKPSSPKLAAAQQEENTVKKSIGTTPDPEFVIPSPDENSRKA